MRDHLTRTRGALVLALAALTLSIATPASHATPGAIDTSFSGGDGKVVRSLGPGLGAAAFRDVVVLGNGKIVAAGSVTVRKGVGGRHFIVARFRPDGRLDRRFSRNGFVVTRFCRSARRCSNNADANELLVLPNGKIMAVGSTGHSNHYGEHFWSLAFARYRRDGSRDRSFGDRGRIGLKVRRRSFWGHAAAVQPNGRIMISGSTRAVDELGPSQALLARVKRNGSWDESFGDAGYVIPQGGSFGALGELNDVRIQADGAIVGAGGTGGIGSDFAVVRYVANGQPDPSFSNDGIVWTPIGLETDSATAAALAPDGGIVVAGYTTRHESNPRPADFAVARYEQSGELDLGFGAGGVRVTDFATHRDDIATDVAIQRNGRILLAGYSGYSAPDPEGSAYFAVARYTADGDADSGFAGDGRRLMYLKRHGYATSLALAPRRRVVLAGATNLFDRDDPGRMQAALVRLRR